MADGTISVRGLRHTYATPHGPLPVIDGLDLEVADGSHVTLVGPSGAGKSTVLSVLGGLEPVQEGRVVVGGTDLVGLCRDELAAFRRSTVGFVFQHFGLLDTLTAAENVSLAGSLNATSRRARARRTDELLGAVGLGHRADHRPAQLSGGERQRVAIARALANQPRIVLADEPTGNLDTGTTGTVMTLLEGLPAKHGCTLVLVTHEPGLADRAPQRVTLAPAEELVTG